MAILIWLYKLWHVYLKKKSVYFLMADLRNPQTTGTLPCFLEGLMQQDCIVNWVFPHVPSNIKLGS